MAESSLDYLCWSQEEHLLNIWGIYFYCVYKHSSCLVKNNISANVFSLNVCLQHISHDGRRLFTLSHVDTNGCPFHLDIYIPYNEILLIEISLA